jgi:hypothetical protein
MLAIPTQNHRTPPQKLKKIPITAFPMTDSQPIEGPPNKLRMLAKADEIKRHPVRFKVVSGGAPAELLGSPRDKVSARIAAAINGPITPYHERIINGFADDELMRGRAMGVGLQK